MADPHNRAAVTLAVGACAMVLAVAAPAGAMAVTERDDASVSMFHAVPGLTVDVFVDGEELLPDFEPGTLTDPRPLDAGTYDIQMFADDEGPDGDASIRKEIEVPAEANATVVAHLDAEGNPVLNTFVNDVSEVPPGQSRLTVRHVAAAPAVDVRANGSTISEGLENPDEETAEVDAGTVPVDVVLAGTDEVVIGPADPDLGEGTSNIVYAWGSEQDDTLAWKVQTLESTGSAPDGVNGAQGDAPVANGSSAWAAVWSTAAVVVLTGVMAVHRRLSLRS